MKSEPSKQSERSACWRRRSAISRRQRAAQPTPIARHARSTSSCDGLCSHASRYHAHVQSCCAASNAAPLPRRPRPGTIASSRQPPRRIPRSNNNPSWPANAATAAPAPPSSSSTTRAFWPTTRSAIPMCASSRCGCLQAMTKARRADAARAAAAAIPCCSTSWAITGSGLAHLNWRPFDENVPERAARLMHEQKMGPCIIVFPDCFTCLGGNQYINSSAIGTLRRLPDARARFRIVDREFRTLASREHRGCFGKSSGGYGAMIHGMKYPETLGRDRQSFGRCVLRLLLPPRLAANAERARPLPQAAAGGPGGRIAPRRRAAGQRLRRRPRAALPRGRVGQGEAERRRSPRAHGDRDGGHLRPGPEGAARLPAAGRSRHRRAHRRAAGRSGRSTTRSTWSAATRGTCARLRGIYMDCGWRDQYHLHFGARILSRQLAAHGVAHTLRGVRRFALVDRLPDGRQPAVSLQVPQTLRSDHDAQSSSTGCAAGLFAWRCSARRRRSPTPTSPPPPVNNADFDLGADAIKVKDWDEAINHLQIAVKAEPTNADAQNLLGYAYRNQKKFELAFKHYGEALRLDPKHQGAHEYIGEAYVMHRRQGQGAGAPGGARTHLRQGLRGVPGLSEGHRASEVN